MVFDAECVTYNCRSLLVGTVVRVRDGDEFSRFRFLHPAVLLAAAASFGAARRYAGGPR